MKQASSSCFLYAIALSGAFLGAASGAQAQSYTAVDLGTLGGDYRITHAMDLNEAGQVAGYGYSNGFSANGNSATDTYQGFVTDTAGANLRGLGFLPGGAWSKGLRMTDSGELYGTAADAAAQVVNVTAGPGASALTPGATPPTSPPQSYQPVDFSNVSTFGQGNSGSSGQYGPISQSTHLDVNAQGQVVGQFTNSRTFGYYAFVTDTQGQAQDVDQLSFAGFAVPSHAGTASFFESATAINNVGQFVANASNGHAYLISPVPEPSSVALMLAGLGLLGCVARGKFRLRSGDGRAAAAAGL